jgi:hypothetical protein
MIELVTKRAETRERGSRLLLIPVCSVLCVLAACSGKSQEASNDNVAQAVQQTVNSATESSKAPAAANAPKETCAQCEQRLCRNFRGSGVDLVAGCYEDADKAKVAACSAAVACGRQSKCGFTQRGAEECYCGTASTENCAKGTGIDGPCKAQFEAAAGTSDVERVTTGFGERKLALGNAVFMLQCDRDFCKDACAP